MSTTVKEMWVVDFDTRMVGSEKFSYNFRIRRAIVTSTCESRGKDDFYRHEYADPYGIKKTVSDTHVFEDVKEAAEFILRMRSYYEEKLKEMIKGLQDYAKSEGYNAA